MSLMNFEPSKKRCKKRPRKSAFPGRFGISKNPAEYECFLESMEFMKLIALVRFLNFDS